MQLKLVEYNKFESSRAKVSKVVETMAVPGKLIYRLSALRGTFGSVTLCAKCSSTLRSFRGLCSEVPPISTPGTIPSSKSAMSKWIRKAEEEARASEQFSWKDISHQKPDAKTKAGAVPDKTQSKQLRAERLVGKFTPETLSSYFMSMGMTVSKSAVFPSVLGLERDNFLYKVRKLYHAGLGEPQSCALAVHLGLFNLPASFEHCLFVLQQNGISANALIDRDLVTAAAVLSSDPNMVGLCR